MNAQMPSRTAYGVALSRAAHQVWDSPKVLDDALALPLVGATGRATIDSSRGGMDGRIARRMRAFVVARARFADEELAQAYAAGVRQCVVLGAGLDTLAYRNQLPGLTVYEVDQPGTQAWKLSQLHAAGIGIPGSVRFVPLDLSRQDLGAALVASGVDKGQPVFFSCLGVSMYLPPAVLLDMLQLVASWTEKSRFVFDYVVPLSHQPLLTRLTYRFFLFRLARIGEPWQGFFDPAGLGERMRTFGFSVVTDLSGPQINQRYFQGRSDGLAVGPSGHLVSVVR
jgi:methyltransferase (TIGR00027 family)